MLTASDKRVDLEHRLAQVELTRTQKGDFDGMTDLRVVIADLTGKIERLRLEEQRLNELLSRQTR